MIVIEKCKNDYFLSHEMASSKNVLQEMCMKQRIELPTYVTERKGGEDHAPYFASMVFVGGLTINGPVHSSRINAEKAVADLAIIALGTPKRAAALDEESSVVFSAVPHIIYDVESIPLEYTYMKQTLQPFKTNVTTVARGDYHSSIAVDVTYRGGEKDMSIVMSHIITKLSLKGTDKFIIVGTRPTYLRIARILQQLSNITVVLVSEWSECIDTLQKWKSP